MHSSKTKLEYFTEMNEVHKKDINQKKVFDLKENKGIHDDYKSFSEENIASYLMKSLDRELLSDPENISELMRSLMYAMTLGKISITDTPTFGQPDTREKKQFNEEPCIAALELNKEIELNQKEKVGCLKLWDIEKKSIEARWSTINFLLLAYDLSKLRDIQRMLQYDGYSVMLQAYLAKTSFENENDKTLLTGFLTKAYSSMLESVSHVADVLNHNRYKTYLNNQKVIERLYGAYIDTDPSKLDEYINRLAKIFPSQPKASEMLHLIHYQLITCMLPFMWAIDKFYGVTEQPPNKEIALAILEKSITLFDQHYDAVKKLSKSFYMSADEYKVIANLQLAEFKDALKYSERDIFSYFEKALTACRGEVKNPIYVRMYIIDKLLVLLERTQIDAVKADILSCIAKTYYEMSQQSLIENYNLMKSITYFKEAELLYEKITGNVQRDKIYDLAINKTVQNRGLLIDSLMKEGNYPKAIEMLRISYIEGDDIKAGFKIVDILENHSQHEEASQELEKMFSMMLTRANIENTMLTINKMESISVNGTLLNESKQAFIALYSKTQPLDELVNVYTQGTLTHPSLKNPIPLLPLDEANIEKRLSEEAVSPSDNLVKSMLAILKKVDPKNPRANDHYNVVTELLISSSLTRFLREEPILLFDILMTLSSLNLEEQSAKKLFYWLQTFTPELNDMILKSKSPVSEYKAYKPSETNPLHDLISYWLAKQHECVVYQNKQEMYMQVLQNKDKSGFSKFQNATSKTSLEKVEDRIIFLNYAKDYDREMMKAKSEKKGFFSSASTTIPDLYPLFNTPLKPDQIMKELEQLAKDKPSAMFALADCYHNGYGTKKDIKEAAKWYFLAALNDLDNGNLRQHAMAKLLEFDTPTSEVNPLFYFVLSGKSTALTTKNNPSDLELKEVTDMIDNLQAPSSLKKKWMSMLQRYSAFYPDLTPNPLDKGTGVESKKNYEDLTLNPYVEQPVPELKVTSNLPPATNPFFNQEQEPELPKKDQVTQLQEQVETLEQRVSHYDALFEKMLAEMRDLRSEVERLKKANVQALSNKIDYHK